MKMFGSISQYFPFLSDESKQIIVGIVDEAEDIRDYIVRLLEESKNHPATSEFFFYSFIHAQSYHDTWDAIRVRSEESNLLKPFRFFRRQSFLTRDEVQPFIDALNLAIATQPDGWILFQLYVLAVWNLGEPERSRFVKLARDFVDSNPEYRCFLTQICGTELYHLRSQGDIEGALAVCNEGIDIAKENDDIAYLTQHLIAKGNMIKDFDVHKGLELLDEGYTMLEKETSRRDAVYAAALIMALAYEALGEYDMALELVFESEDVSSEYSDTTDPMYALVAARIYNVLEQPVDALEWLRSCSDSLEFHTSQNYALAAHAYSLLGQVDQAESLLNKAHVIAINSGNEQEIMLYFVVRGMIDFSQGNNSSACDNITQALELADPQFQITVNNCLSALTKIEIAETTRTNNKLDAETSGTWMSRLRKHAYEKNYLGIKMTHALLKSEYQVKIGENEAAKQTLSDALEMTDSATVKTLRKRIDNKLKELEAAPRSS